MPNLDLTPRRDPFVWVTWIPPLLAGDTHCEFMLHQLGNFVAPKSNDELPASWFDDHNRLVSEVSDQYQQIGRTVRIEDENRVEIVSKSGVKVVGKPDILVEEVLTGPDKSRGIIVDAKTGRQRSKDRLQVMLYMLMTNAARSISGISQMPDGQLVYKDGTTIDIPYTEITDDFKKSVSRLLAIVALAEPPDPRPSGYCRFCKFLDICPSAEQEGHSIIDETDDF